jgi:hypothetical protein
MHDTKTEFGINQTNLAKVMTIEYRILRVWEYKP